MKTKFYSTIALVFLIFAVSAQKYNSMLTENWNNGLWEKASKTTNTYDFKGDLLIITTQHWNTSINAWDNYMITSHTLNLDGTIKESLTNIDYMDGNGWVNMSKLTFTYNGSKQVLTEVMQSPAGAAWIDSQTKTYTYNAAGKVTLILTTKLSKNYMQTIYTYNSDGSADQTLTQKWNTSNQWENASRILSTYISSTQKSSDLHENWFFGAWQNSWRYTYTSRNNGSELEVLIVWWVGSNWSNFGNLFYKMNSNQEPIEAIAKIWHSDLNVWENDSRLTWNFIITDIKPVELAGKAITVFPNPFVDKLTVENRTLDKLGIQVFNINGQLVNSFIASGSLTEMNLGSLKMGTYFMKIHSPQNEQTIKLLKVE